jgi:hypothetical protein
MSEIIDFIDAIDIHLSQFIGENEVEELYDDETEPEPIDLLWIKADEKTRPYSILMTCGLSSKAINIPNAQPGEKYAELAMILPKNSSLADAESKDEKKRWPFEHIRDIAHEILDGDSELNFGAIFTYDEDENFCFPGTNFNSSVILNSKTLPDSFVKIKFNSNIIRLYSVVPLYLQEYIYLEQNNVNSLLDKFNDHTISEIIDVNRTNTCKL